MQLGDINHSAVPWAGGPAHRVHILELISCVALWILHPLCRPLMRSECDGHRRDEKFEADSTVD